LEVIYLSSDIFLEREGILECGIVDDKLIGTYPHDLGLDIDLFGIDSGSLDKSILFEEVNNIGDDVDMWIDYPCLNESCLVLLEGVDLYTKGNGLCTGVKSLEYDIETRYLCLFEFLIDIV